MDEADIAVIGAGPAGMAAALCAAEHGLQVVLLDEHPAPGGQIWRGVDAASHRMRALLGKDYGEGRIWTEAMPGAPLIHLAGATVWRIDPDGAVTWSKAGKARRLRARRVILATGALERPAPMPGWTLPGVMTAGAAQLMLKQSGLVPERAVLAGCGPLLYLLAQQMIRAGAPPLALVETQTHTDLLRAAPHLPGALRGWRYLAKGAAMLREIARAGAPRHPGATELRVEGAERAEALAFRSGGRTHRVACSTVLLHVGVVPNTQATRALGLPHEWDARQRCFRPKTDEWGRTALETVLVAGDGAGIGGAKAAVHAGRLAALEAARGLGALDAAARDRLAAPHRRARAHELAARPFLDAAYPPPSQCLRPDDEVIICRCEEVTAGAIRDYAALGCRGPNQTKAFGRSGMGPCQGRYCGLTVTELLAQASDAAPAAVGAYRIRAPLKPISLGELASLAEPPEASGEEPTP